MTGRRDEILGAAIRRLPVPDHGATFWTDLDELLAREEGKAGRDAPSPSRHRRPWARPALVAALAAAVLVVAVATTRLVGDGDREVRTIDHTTTSAGPPSTTQAPAGCSAGGLPARPEPQPGLPDAVALLRERIVAAATACDYERLAALGGSDAARLQFNFGGAGDPAEFWRQQEDQGGKPLRHLVELLDRPYATREAADVTQYLWPSAYA